MRIIAIIPAYHEAARVGAAVADALAYVDAVVVVDDCSADASGEVALQAGAIVLRHSVNRGQGAALQTGTDYALRHLQPEVIVHFDADGQMQGQDIATLVAPILADEADIVIGSRFLGTKALNMPLFRRLVLGAGVIFTALVSGIKVTDSQNGFRALSRQTAMDLRISLDRMAHASEILDLIKAKGLRFQERPVTIKYSEETLDKSPSTWRAFGIARDLIKKKLV
ncbi:MAG: glycosyltransferase family 2 protein [Patescibacteria group bacterium]